MQRTHKIRLYPNDRQETYLRRCCGTARFAYNWALKKWEELYKLHEENPDDNPSPNQLALRRKLNNIKRKQFPWMLEVTKYAPQQAIINLGKAFDNYFKGHSQYPVPKKKGIHDSFYIGSDQLKIDGRKVWIPGLYSFMGKRRRCAWVRMAEHLRYGDAKVLCATVSRTAGQWHIAITCELPDVRDVPRHKAETKVLGIDLGVGRYVDSDGKSHVVPRSYRKAMRKLRRAQKSLSRKRKGSRNYAKQRAKFARIHKKVADCRQDWLHKLSNEVTENNDVIGLEDLNVSGMCKNHKLAISVSDAGFHEFRRQVEYKSETNGCKVVFANRWYPSSKTCSCCGSVKTKLSLSKRDYESDVCGFTCDRDLNAAINLRDIAASSAVTACGEFSASVPRKRGGTSSLCEAGRKHQPDSVVKDG